MGKHNVAVELNDVAPCGTDYEECDWRLVVLGETKRKEYHFTGSTGEIRVKQSAEPAGRQ